MSFLWRLFRAPPPADDYESVLAALASDIAQRQSALAALRARERYASTLVTLYALAAWAVYLAVWYFGFVASVAGVRGIERAVRALPVVVGPILILFIRRIVQIWYNRKGNAEEKTLQSLLKQQRAKVEEIKKKTNFYSTRELLARYDGSAPNSPSPSHRAGGQTPQRPGPASALSVSQNGRPGAASPSSAPSSAQQQQNQPRQTQQQPAQRKWFDALADLLVGAEDGGAERERQKYALICGRCFAHNGLVPAGVWGDAQYTCPKCGHFNPSARSRRVLEGAASPSASPSASTFAGGASSVSSAPGRGSQLGAMSPVSPTSPMGGLAGATMTGGGGGSSARQHEHDTANVRRRSGRGLGHAEAEADGESEGEAEEMEVDSDGDS